MTPGQQFSSRIAAGEADLVIGADIVVVSSDGPVSRMAAGRTRAVVSDDVRPTVAFAAYRDLDFSSDRMVKRLRHVDPRPARPRRRHAWRRSP